MRDLFSGCMYVRTYVAVTLRNVNLWSRSECQFALTLRNDLSVTDTCVTRGRRWRTELGGMMFLGDGGWGGQCGWAFAMYLIGGVECRNKC